MLRRTPRQEAQHARQMAVVALLEARERGKVHAVIKEVAKLPDNEGKPLMLSLIGTPSQASDKITEAMHKILPPAETPDITQGTFISSHSWRKWSNTSHTIKSHHTR